MRIVLLTVFLMAVGCTSPGFEHPAESMRDPGGRFIAEVDGGSWVPYQIYFVEDPSARREEPAEVAQGALISCAAANLVVPQEPTAEIPKEPAYAVEILGGDCISLMNQFTSVAVTTRSGRVLPCLTRDYPWVAPDINGNTWWWFMRVRFERLVPADDLASVVLWLDGGHDAPKRLEVPIR